MRATHTVSYVEVGVLSGESCGERVGDIEVVGDKADIVIGLEQGTGAKKFVSEEDH